MLTCSATARGGQPSARRHAKPPTLLSYPGRTTDGGLADA